MAEAPVATVKMRNALFVFTAAFALFALTGCVPSDDPKSLPASSAPGAPPQATPSVSPTVGALTLPENCEDLVSISWVKAHFGERIELIPFDPSDGGPVSQDFAARGGLVCFWGLPQSDGGFTLSIAERATPTDAAQIANWEASGYLLGPDFLDACWYRQGPTEVGDSINAFVLVDGYEIQTNGFGSELDPYLELIWQATDSMGYL